VDPSPTSRLLIYGIFFSLLVIMAFAFFALTGGSIRPGGMFAMSLSDVLYEPAAPESGGRAGTPAPPYDARKRQLPSWESRRVETHREPSVPETPAEAQYYAAVQKSKDQEERQAARLKSRDDLLQFLETPLGRDFRAIAELARRGRTAEAHQHVKKVLEALADADPAIQRYGLAIAIHLYKQERDAPGLADMLRRYLEMLRSRLVGERDLSARERDSSPESLRKLEDLIAEVERFRRGAGAGR
jgi:hypothetical protein